MVAFSNLRESFFVVMGQRMEKGGEISKSFDKTENQAVPRDRPEGKQHPLGMSDLMNSMTVETSSHKIPFAILTQTHKKIEFLLN